VPPWATINTPAPSSPIASRPPPALNSEAVPLTVTVPVLPAPSPMAIDALSGSEAAVIVTVPAFSTVSCPDPASPTQIGPSDRMTEPTPSTVTMPLPSAVDMADSSQPSTIAASKSV